MKNVLDRREFLRRAAAAGIAISLGGTLPLMEGCSAKREVKIKGREAMYYKKLSGKVVQCGLCPDNCVISNWERGFCQVRENREGALFTVAYGNPCAVHVDPIEKKPLFHFLPGAAAFSIATAGCNFKCKNCQNWDISQSPPEDTDNFALSPEEVSSQALAAGAPVIAYTYSEPTIFYEYMLESARSGQQKGLLSMFHSNGFIHEKPLRGLAPYLNAANVDLKGMTEDFYEDICQGELKPVLRTLQVLKEEGVWLEITNLVMPGYNDSREDFEKISGWILDNLGDMTPVHFSRFYPMHRLKNLPPTTYETLQEARNTALERGLKYVYIGNWPETPAEHTYCHNCGKPVIKRNGYQVLENNLENGECRFCRQAIPGIWQRGEGAA